MRKVIILNLSLFLISLFISCGCLKKPKYNILNAPKSTNILADYENIFTKKEYNDLLNQMKSINKKYEVKIYFITLYSVCNMGYSPYDMMWQKIHNIFNIEYTAKYSIAYPKIIYVFSHHDRYNFIVKSSKFNKIWNEERYLKAEVPIIDKYFGQYKYYQAFKEIFEVLDKELAQSRKEGKL